jgi:hypothetical protein
MTTHSAHELKNGDILSVSTNVGASPRYFLNDEEITMNQYYQIICNDHVEKNMEVLRVAQNTWWTLVKRMFGIK